MNWDKLLSEANDYHIPCGLFVFVTGTVVHWLHGIDANYVAMCTVVLGAITGHAIWAPGQKRNGDGEDKGTEGPKG